MMLKSLAHEVEPIQFLFTIDSPWKHFDYGAIRCAHKFKEKINNDTQQKIQIILQNLPKIYEV